MLNFLRDLLALITLPVFIGTVVLYLFAFIEVVN
jgi:hypothetical protein